MDFIKEPQLKLATEPFWEKTEAPEFINKTGTKYARIPYDSYFVDRGIETNRLFDSLIAFLPDGAFIAGGFMTSLMQGDKQAKDIDLFFKSPEAFNRTMMLLQNPPKDKEAWAWQGYSLDTDPKLVLGDRKELRFIKFIHPKRPPIQLVKLVWYDDAEHVIDSFDLTISQFAYDPVDDTIVTNPLAVLDLSRKRLVLHRMQFPVSTLRRVIKYTQKGYYACPGSLATISKAIAESYQRNPSELNSVVYLD